MIWLFFIFCIYAFGGYFYPKQLLLSFKLVMCVLRFEPMTFVLLMQYSVEQQEHQSLNCNEDCNENYFCIL